MRPGPRPGRRWTWRHRIRPPPTPAVPYWGGCRPDPDASRPHLQRRCSLDSSCSSGLDLAIPEAVEQVGGLQTQYAPSGYVGLWTRLAGFERAALTAGLEDRSVVQATLMRVTIHIVSRREYWRFALGVRQARRAPGGSRHRLAGHGNGPWRRPLSAASGPGGRPSDRQGARRSRHGLRRDTRAVGRPRAGAAGRDVGAPSGRPARPGRGLARSPRRHRGRGRRPSRSGLPAGIRSGGWRDIASWAGISVTTARGRGGPGSAVVPRRGRRSAGGSGRRPAPDPDTPTPVRFLPHWDANLLVHARRTGLLPEAFRSRVFSTKNPFSVGTYLVDGSSPGGGRSGRANRPRSVRRADGT